MFEKCNSPEEQMACRDAGIGLEKKEKAKKGNPLLFRCAPWKNLYMIPKRKDVFMWVKKKKKTTKPTEGQVEQS